MYISGSSVAEQCFASLVIAHVVNCASDTAPPGMVFPLFLACFSGFHVLVCLDLWRLICLVGVPLAFTYRCV